MIILKEYKYGWFPAPIGPVIPIAILLSQISSSTRRIVRAAPLLWTCIDSEVLTKPSHLHLYLELSCQCLLDISVTDVSNERGQFPIMMPLLAHASRWRRFHMWINTKADLRHFVIMFKHMRLQSLKQLDLTCWNEDDGDDALPHVEGSFLRGGTPCLQEISISNMKCLPLASHSLNRLILHNASYGSPLWSCAQFAEMLSKMPSLTCLEMTGPVVEIEEIPIRTIALPSLRSLTLIEDEPDTLDNRSLYHAGILALFTDAPLGSISLCGPLVGAFPSILEALRTKRLHFPHVTDLYWDLLDESWEEEDEEAFIQAFPRVEEEDRPFQG
ncbi:hypothetical protein HWV62_22570 [Athelia sp. TMB]|nr:hypothetical protein HWV62_22570 [Athelia sp. TMB]